MYFKCPKLSAVLSIESCNRSKETARKHSACYTCKDREVLHKSGVASKGILEIAQVGLSVPAKPTIVRFHRYKEAKLKRVLRDYGSTLAKGKNV